MILKYATNLLIFNILLPLIWTQGNSKRILQTNDDISNPLNPDLNEKVIQVSCDPSLQKSQIPTHLQQYDFIQNGEFSIIENECQNYSVFDKISVYLINQAQIDSDSDSNNNQQFNCDLKKLVVEWECQQHQIEIKVNTIAYQPSNPSEYKVGQFAFKIKNSQILIDRVQEAGISNLYFHNQQNQILLKNINQKLVLQGFQLHDSLLEEHSPILIQKVQQLIIEKSVFKNNKNILNNGGALSILDIDDTFTMNNCTFSSNYGLQSGGALFLHTIYKTEIKNSHFLSNNGTNGGAIYVTNYTEFTSKNNHYENNVGLTSGYGGALRIMDGSLAIFEQDSFLNNFSDIYGGGIYLGKVTDYMLIKQVNFTKNYAGLQGGGASLYEINNGIIQDSTFLENVSNENGGGLRLFKGENVTIQNLTMESNSANDWGGCILVKTVLEFHLKNSKLSKCHSGNRGGAVCIISYSDQMTIKNVTFTENDAKQTGGALYVENSNYQQYSNLTFLENKSSAGGGIYIYNIKHSEIQDIIAHKNKVKTSGGALSVSNSLNLTIKSVDLKFNEANTGAGFSFQSVQETNISDIDFQNNLSEQSSAGIIFSSCQKIELKNFEFLNNRALFGGVAMEINFSYDILADNLKIFENIIESQGSGLKFLKTDKFNFSNIIIENLEGSGVELSKSQEGKFTNFTIQNNVAENGGAMVMRSVDVFLLEDSQIKTNQAIGSGGGILLSQSHKIGFKNVQFVENIAKKGAGGGVSASECGNLDFEKCLFDSNEADNDGQNGGALFIEDTDESSDGTKLIQSTFKKNIGNYRGGGLFGYQYHKFFAQNCFFEANKCEDEGCGFYLEKGDEGIVEDSVFQNHEGSDEASAFYCEKSDKLTVRNCNFENNESITRGGAFSTSRIKEALYENNKFVNNKCFSEDEYCYGGALFIRRGGSNTLIGNQFISNQAHRYGGALYVQDTEDIFIFDSLFDGNTVEFNQNLTIFEKNQDYFITQGGGAFLEVRGQIGLKNSLFKNSQASSGAGILINYEIDQEKEEENQISIYAKDLQFENNIADLGPGLRVLIGSHFEKIIANITNPSGQNNTSRLNPGKIVEYEYFRNEKIQSEKSFQYDLCNEGYQLLKGGQLNCNKCYEHGICEGGYIPIYPKEHYWADPKSESEGIEFFYCYNYPGACMGNFTCQEGYAGVLCEQCDILNGYTKSSSNRCNECYSDMIVASFLVMSYLLLTGLVLSAMRGVVNKIEGNLKVKFLKGFGYKLKVSDQLSAIIKITIMHFQIFTLIESLSLEFPGVLNIGLTGVGNPSKILSRVLECFFELKDPDQIIYQNTKVEFIGFLLSQSVVILFIVCQTIYFCFKKRMYKKNHKKYLSQYKLKMHEGTAEEQNQLELKTKKYQDSSHINEQLHQYIKCALLCFFITVQPGVLQNSMVYLQCRKFGTENYCAGDTNINCDSTYYKSTVYPANLAIVLIFAVIVPVVIWFQLYGLKKKKALKWLYSRRAYGILYMETKEKYYYWDIIIIFLKTISVMTTYLFEKEGNVEMQILVTILIIYGVFFMVKKPYSTPNLNTLSLVSIGTLIISIALSQTLTQGGQHYSGFVFLVWIVISSSNLFTMFFSLYVMFPDFKRIFRKYMVTWFRNIGIVQRLLHKIEKEKKPRQLWNLLFYSIKSIEKKKILQTAQAIYMAELKNKYQMVKDYKQQDMSFRQIESFNFTKSKVKMNQDFLNDEISRNSMENLQQFSKNNSGDMILNGSVYSRNYELTSERFSDRALTKQQSENLESPPYMKTSLAKRTLTRGMKGAKKSTYSQLSKQQQQQKIQKSNMNSSSNSQGSHFFPQDNRRVQTHQYISSQPQFTEDEDEDKSSSSYSQQNLKQQIQQQQQQFQQQTSIISNMNSDNKLSSFHQNKSRENTQVKQIQQTEIEIQNASSESHPSAFSFTKIENHQERTFDQTPYKKNSLTAPQLDNILPYQSPSFCPIRAPSDTAMPNLDNKKKVGESLVDIIDSQEVSYREEDLREDFNNDHFFEDKHQQNIQNFVNTSMTGNSIFSKVKDQDEISIKFQSKKTLEE